MKNSLVFATQNSQKQKSEYSPLLQWVKYNTYVEQP